MAQSPRKNWPVRLIAYVHHPLQPIVNRLRSETRNERLVYFSRPRRPDRDHIPGYYYPNIPLKCLIWNAWKAGAPAILPPRQNVGCRPRSPASDRLTPMRHKLFYSQLSSYYAMRLYWYRNSVCAPSACRHGLRWIDKIIEGRMGDLPVTADKGPVELPTNIPYIQYVCSVHNNKLMSTSRGRLVYKYCISYVN